MSLDVCLPVQDNLGMSIFDPRNTILTCQEVKEKLYNKEICLVPTDNGIKVSLVTISRIVAMI